MRSLRNPDVLTSWIHTIPKYTVHKEIRTRYRSRHVVFEAEPPEISEEPMQDRALLNKHIRLLLASMPAKESAPIEMRYISEMEPAGIATRQNWSLAKTKRQMARARDKFRTIALQRPFLSASLGELGILGSLLHREIPPSNAPSPVQRRNEYAIYNPGKVSG